MPVGRQGKVRHVRRGADVCPAQASPQPENSARSLGRSLMNVVVIALTEAPHRGQRPRSSASTNVSTAIGRPVLDVRPSLEEFRSPNIAGLQQSQVNPVRHVDGNAD